MLRPSGEDRASGGGTIIHNQGDAALLDRCHRECRHQRGYDILGIHFGISSNEPFILDRVDPFLAGFEAPAVAGEGDAIRFYVPYDASLEKRFSMVTSAARYVESGSWETVFGYLMNQLHAWLWARLPDVLPLHSGAVAWEGRGLVIPAASGGGKTTLALELSSHGWDYLSDEFAPICLSTLRVLPFARRPHVSADAVRALLGQRSERVLAGRPFLDDDGTDRYLVSIADVGRVGSPAEISFLVFPEMSSAGPRLDPLPKAEALGMLAACILSHQYATEWQLRSIDALARMVRCAQCYRLALGPIGSNAGLLTDVASGRGSGVSVDAEPGQDELAALEHVAIRTRALVRQRASEGRSDPDALYIERGVQDQDDR